MSTSPAPHKVFDAVALSSTNTVYSGSTRLGGAAVPGNAIGTAPNGRHMTYQGAFTSTPNGSLTVEVSNASDEDVRKGTDQWDTYTQVTGDGFSSGVATVTSGQINSKATFAIELKNFAYKRSRLKYTNTSGTGTITATVHVKV